MRSLRYRASAIRDLNDIASSTRERWGRDQAKKYTDRLRVDIKGLREFALRFPAHIARSGRYRKMRSGSHVVFYLVNEAEVEIIRIVHQSRDFDSQLG